MKTGCIHSKLYDQHLGKPYTLCQLRHNVINNRSIHCSGTVAEKTKCPEWGEAVAAEEFYRKKLKD
jgi:hypothetical protein